MTTHKLFQLLVSLCLCVNKSIKEKGKSLCSHDLPPVVVLVGGGSVPIKQVSVILIRK